jgi:hypothetical protein
MSALCNKPIRTDDNTVKPCLCARGHVGGCNPFSPNPYMAVVIPQQELPKRDKIPLPQVTDILNLEARVWTEQSIIQRCLWQGAHGRCIYELGNHTEHKEDTPNAG